MANEIRARAEDVVTNEVKQEYRIVCRSHGKPGHHEHTYVKEGLELCQTYMAKLDERTTNAKEREMEVPFSIQTRVVSEWEKVSS